MTPQPIFTAREFAAAMGIAPRTLRWHLRNVSADAVKVVAGNETEAWKISSLPGTIRDRLGDLARKRGFRNAEGLLENGGQSVPVPLQEIADKEIERAGKLREALRPFLLRRHDQTVSTADFENDGVAAYGRAFSHTVTARHWRRLMAGVLQRDGGQNQFDRLELYLPDKPALKRVNQQSAEESAEEIPGVRQVVNAARNPAELNRHDRDGIWGLAISHFDELLSRGTTSKRAARKIRDLLFSQAPQLAPSRDAMLKAFNRKLEEVRQRGRPTDFRKNNGEAFRPPGSDIDLLRDSAAHKNGVRMDAAWREEYPRLSEYTSSRYKPTPTMPEAVRELANRELTEAIWAANQGDSALRALIGGVTRKKDSDIPAMHKWVVDDLTATIECVFNEDGTDSLILPQIVGVMDSASRKFVGVAIAPQKAPDSELACEAVLDGFKKFGVPRNLHVENGFVFGKSLNINGKVDRDGRTIVAGLGSYGCSVRHFQKRNPQSKGELEKAFDLLQRLFERHPGYTGRIQMLHASDSFRREQRLIRAGKIEATTKRYTYEEVCRVIMGCFEKYNATPREALGWRSPNEVFEERKDPSCPPITFTPELHWLLANERYWVRVKAGGVTFNHFARPIRVRGTQLAGFIGKELWAVVDRHDSSMVTFMKKGFAEPFTMEACKETSNDEAQMEPGSGVLAKELEKIGEHSKAIKGERNRLVKLFGNHKEELLENARQHHTSTVHANPNLVESGAVMQQQRAEIILQRKASEKRRNKTNRAARVAGAASEIVANSEALEELNNLLPDA